MKDIEKSKSIRDGLRKGFRDGTSKMAQRRCYGYDTGSSDGFMDRYLYSDSHETIISDEMFKAAQQKKLRRAKCPDKIFAMQELF